MPAEQGLHSIEAFAAPHELGGHTGDPRSIADYTASCSAIKREGMLAEGTLLGDKTASVSCSSHHLSFSSFISLSLLFSLQHRCCYCHCCLSY